METLEQSPTKSGFFSHMFSLGGEDKGQLLNYIQYISIAIVPVVCVLKALRAYVPEEDEDKGALATLSESFGQVLVIFLSIWLIDRLIRYIPTYSGVTYQPMYLTNFVLAFLMILLTVQSKLGAKVDILVDKVTSLWSGDTSLKDSKDKKKTAGKDAPAKAAPPQAAATRQPTHQVSRADYLDDRSAPGGQQQQPDFNSMYSGPVTHLQDAQTPGENLPFEPAAANAVLGSNFGSMF